MAPIALRLLSLNTDIPIFLSALKKSDVKPLTINKVVRWIILPKTRSLVSSVLAQDVQWDLLLVLPTDKPLPTDLQKLVKKEWYVTAGMPSSMLKNFHETNQKLLHPEPGTVPKLSEHQTGQGMKLDSQSLELSPELANWISDFSSQEGKGAMSMFNLLSFKPGRKASYLRYVAHSHLLALFLTRISYGKAFSADIGKTRGGIAKIVGKVIDVSSSPKSGGEIGDNGMEFDEVAVASYPSILHFAEMLRAEDYQKVNHEHRVPALRDTFILCTTELAPELTEAGKSKL